MIENPQVKWTPGPWRHQINRMGHIWWVLAGSTKKPVHVAEVMGSTREADARLISTAPRLYDALESILGLIETGVLVRNIEHDHEPEWLLNQVPLVRALAEAHAVLAKVQGTKFWKATVRNVSK